MRLLSEGELLDVIGGFLVAAFTLAVSWTGLEAVLGMPGFFSCLVSVAAAAGALEVASRRHYAPPPASGRRSVDPPLRLVSSDGQTSGPPGAALSTAEWRWVTPPPRTARRRGTGPTGPARRRTATSAHKVA